MQELSPQQIKKLEKLAKVGDIGIADELNALESKIEALEAIVPVLREARDGEKGERGDTGERGEKGDTGERGADGRDGVDGRDGKDGVNGKDGRDGVDGKDGRDGKDGEMGVIDEATIAYLEDGIAKAQVDFEQFNRAIGIVDQRSSFLINKVSNLDRDKITGVGVHTITVSDTAPTNPSTGDIWIDTDAYAFRAVTGTYTITSEDYFLGCDGTFTITLPSAVSFTGEYIIKNVGTGLVTVATTSSQTIDGAPTFQLIEDEVITLRSTNSNWLIV